MSRHHDLVRLYCALAGICDFATGCALIVAPLFVLRWMGIGVRFDAGADTIYLRYLGTFVAAIGASYLYPLALSGDAGDRRLPAVLEVTALVRGAVALFVTAAVASGALATPWLSVAGIDGGLAALQVGMLVRGAAGTGTEARP